MLSPPLGTCGRLRARWIASRSQSSASKSPAVKPAPRRAGAAAGSLYLDRCRRLSLQLNQKVSRRVGHGWDALARRRRTSSQRSPAAATSSSSRSSRRSSDRPGGQRRRTGQTGSQRRHRQGIFIVTIRCCSCIGILAFPDDIGRMSADRRMEAYWIRPAAFDWGGQLADGRLCACLLCR
jgi:hypothetical protein